MKNNMKPYSEEKSGNVIRRTFSNIVENSELVWHRDKEDRIVLVLQENDWMLQFDNQLPKKLNTNEEYFIPKNVYHRVIKGSSDLVVEIIETTFDDDVNENLEEAKKKDACYYKVKSRYDVWPSAYASGALVKCRKVGAANWGTKSEGEESIEEKWSEKYKKSIDCNNPKGFSQRAHCQGRKKANEVVETYSLDELIVYENKDIEKSNQELIKLAHDSITRTKGKDYSPDVHELQAWIDNYLKESDNKTDFSKEKEQGLHGWFARQGGEGKSKGWVDCNTCRKDPETGKKKCKSCGRKSGEERSKYPSCRPTPSACKTSGKGEKWGKAKENLQVSENISTFDKDFIKKVLKETFNQEDTMTKPMIEPQVKPEPKVVPAPDKVQPNISPSRRNKPFLPMPGIETDPKAITK